MEENLKQLLLKDLCARLPYGVFINTTKGDSTIDTIQVCCNNDVICSSEKGHEIIDCVKPYLRPMSSMTEEEEKIFRDFLDFQAEYVSDIDLDNKTDMFDWLLANHFDFRGLIPVGLAIEAPEDMYKTE